MRTIRRRRKENKTNYSKRLELLKADLPRVVFRKTNRYIIAQVVKSHEAKDIVETGITSKNLLEYGWPKEMSGSLKSIPASYLTGFLLGKLSLSKSKGDVILDVGMIRMIYKNRAFAFINGLKDAGIKIKSDEKTFPDKDRITGKHLSSDFTKTFETIKSKIEKGK